MKKRILFFAVVLLAATLFAKTSADDFQVVFAHNASGDETGVIIESYIGGAADVVYDGVDG